MKYELELIGFKCFIKEKFILNNITVLTGSNASGKSSMIQALLLIRSAIDRNDFGRDRGQNLMDTAWYNAEIPLNDNYELHLGTVNDIFNNNSFDGKEVLVNIGSEKYRIPFPSNSSNDTFVKVHRSESNDTTKEVTPHFLYDKDFYYLNAERIGPRMNLPIKYTDFSHCGHKGEFTAQVLLQNEFQKVSDPMRHEESKSNLLPQNVDAWLNEICPGVSVRAKYLDSHVSQMRLRNSASREDVLATNIGFGVSYSLPIIVTGLIAKSGTMFIVENPEAHLHPKGQSNMGYFLGKLAASGVRIIVETHSEHIVNGIRRAMVSDDRFKSEDITMYFFDRRENALYNTTEISVKPTGDLSPFPKDYFDQVQQDMSAIFQINKGKNNG